MFMKDVENNGYFRVESQVMAQFQEAEWPGPFPILLELLKITPVFKMPPHTFRNDK